ncbi:hypothetical protein [Mesorhizobium sp. INR15]|uniref:hypothetical protein n=1 Tax=Mesorhizobium sp. INR15 TaxID=2654248 RepID=UPI0018964544|nr:hypothetical protein [Mesorhizobium sp. INR15]QPC93273.1 hypothetical protein GA829_23380 [Mesorhizobium sp. INR15]
MTGKLITNLYYPGVLDRAQSAVNRCGSPSRRKPVEFERWLLPMRRDNRLKTEPVEHCRDAAGIVLGIGQFADMLVFGLADYERDAFQLLRRLGLKGTDRAICAMITIDARSQRKRSDKEFR